MYARTRTGTKRGRSRGQERGLPFLEAVLLPLVEEVRLGGAEVDDLGAAVAVLLLDGALLAVVGVRDAGPAADHAAALVRAVVALVADTDLK